MRSRAWRCSSGAAHLNPVGYVHGGWFASILDSAPACAVHTRLPVGRSYTAAELSVNIVRALHCGRRLATAQAWLMGPDGTL